MISWLVSMNKYGIDCCHACFDIFWLFRVPEREDDFFIKLLTLDVYVHEVPGNIKIIITIFCQEFPLVLNGPGKKETRVKIKAKRNSNKISI